MVPAATAPPQRSEELTEPELRLLVGQLNQRINYLLITISPGAVVVDGTRKPDNAARLPLA
jgi:fructose-bisphosphate aldolase class 1